MPGSQGESEEERIEIDDLLIAAQSGSANSLGALLDHFRNYLLLMADTELAPDLKVKASPSDLVQESFLEATHDFHHFKGTSPAQFQAWLRRILLNNIANIGRDFRGTVKRNLGKERSLYSRDDDRSSLIPLQSPDRTASSIAMTQETENALQAAIRKLPSHYQDVIQWRNYDRESFDEIGRRLNRTGEAARKLWVRALESLQQEFDLANDSIPPRRGIPTE